MRVLFITKNVEDIERVSLHLELSGYDVVCCDNKFFVDEYFVYNTTELVLLDFETQDSKDILLDLRCGENSNDCKIILYTDDYADVCLNFKSVVDEILSKDLDLDILSKILIEILYDT